MKARAVQVLLWVSAQPSLSPRAGNGSVRFSRSGKYAGLILDVVSVVVQVTKQKPGEKPFLAAKGKSLTGESKTDSLAAMDIPSARQRARPTSERVCDHGSQTTMTAQLGSSWV